MSAGKRLAAFQRKPLPGFAAIASGGGAVRPAMNGDGARGKQRGYPGAKTGCGVWQTMLAAAIVASVEGGH